MRLTLLAACLAVASGLGLQAGPAAARDREGLRLPPGQLAEPPRARAATVSPSDAARIAQQQNGGGRVLAVEAEGGGYRVKLLKNGDVRIVYVPGGQ